MKKLILSLVLAVGLVLPGSMSVPNMSNVANASTETVTVKWDNTPLFWVDPDDPRSGQQACNVKQGTVLNVVSRRGGDFKVSPQTDIRTFTGICYSSREYYVRRTQVTNSGLHPDNYPQTVFTARSDRGFSWGDEVPVFKSRSEYFNARKRMDNGEAYDREVCTIPVGTKVRFKIYKNWGTGEVDSENCSGWTDRSVIR